jgi:hypothetical protein
MGIDVSIEPAAYIFRVGGRQLSSFIFLVQRDLRQRRLLKVASP